MLYVWAEPWQTDVAPDIVPGWEGSAVDDTVKVRAVLAPHELLAVTEIIPPDAPGVAVIDVEVELPLQPDGNVQV